MSDYQTAYSQLNKNQQLAVDTIEGPVMVVAGPGTGKTQTLALRIANIIQSTDTPPSAILALTFTESATLAMRRRLTRFIGPTAYQIHIATFHSFCASVIAEFPHLFEVNQTSSNLTEVERLDLIRQLIIDGDYDKLRPSGRPDLYVRAASRALQDLKREAVTPDQLRQLAVGDKHQQKLEELADLYQQYQSTLHQTQRYDFDDMILWVINAFQTQPQLLATYQERYLYLLADEYQDTNSAQNQILMQLASYWGPQANIFVVGDPDQSIYRFQGASLANLTTFQTQFPDATTIHLQDNYRSQQTILDAAHGLIQNNSVTSSTFMSRHPELDSGSPHSQANNSVNTLTQILNHPPATIAFRAGLQDDKPLTAHKKYRQSKLQVVQTPNQLLELAYLGQSIQRLLKSDTTPEQIAILVRDNQDSLKIADYLAQLNIPHHDYAAADIISTPTVRQIIILLTTLNNLHTDTKTIDLYPALNLPFWDHVPLDLIKLAHFAGDHKTNILKALEITPESRHCEEESSTTRQSLSSSIPNFENLETLTANLQNLASSLTLLTDYSLTDWILHTLQNLGFTDWLLNQPDYTSRLADLQAFIDFVSSLKLDNSLDQLLTYLQTIQSQNLSINRNDLTTQASGVQIMTAHRAKGLEFAHIFIPRATERKWGGKSKPQLIKLPAAIVPHPTDDKADDQLEEQRRLMYVAITRAQQTCTLTYADQYLDQLAIPSQFIYELPETTTHHKTITPDDQQLIDTLKTVLVKAKSSESRDLALQEQEFLQQQLETFHLSASALNTYLDCPYLFKLKYLIKVPQPGSPNLTYGNAVHFTLQKHNQHLLAGQSPDQTLLIDTFKQSLTDSDLPETILPVWLDRGVTALTAYFQNYHQTFTPPLYVERFIGGSRHPVLFHDISLTGKIDRIDALDPKSKAITMTDYKTGRSRSRNDILGKTKSSNGNYYRQLLFYALLVQQDPSLPLQPTSVILDFVEPNSSGKLVQHQFDITPEELTELGQTITQVMTDIRALKFNHAPDCDCATNTDINRIAYPEGPPVLTAEAHQLELL